MALPAWSFLIVGLLVTVVSLYVGKKLQFFFYVGLIFIAWALFKLTVNYLLRPPKKVEERRIERKINTVIACPYCATAVYTTARFCHICGGRLK